MMNYVDMNVEYIMTNGQQFILTDWIPLTDTKIEMYFLAKDVVNKENLKNTIFSAHDKKTQFTINNGGGGAQGHILFLWNNVGFNNGDPIKTISFKYYEYSKTPQLFCMSKDSVEYYSGSIMEKMPLVLRTKPCTTPLSLFTNGYNRSKLYIYGIRCWNNGILERDFVPAKDNGIYGLYDNVNKKFWRSSSGVDFLGKDK